MRETQFLEELYRLVETPVVGMERADKLRMIQAHCGYALEADNSATPAISIVPFVMGRRPTNEIFHAGLGSSDHAGMILADDANGQNVIYILFELHNLDSADSNTLNSLSFDITLSFAGADGSLLTQPIPNWHHRPIPTAILSQDANGTPVIQPVDLTDNAKRRFVVALSPSDLFLPGQAWEWSDIDERVQHDATDGTDPFTFGHLFMQVVHVQLRLLAGEVVVDSAETQLHIGDTRRFGTLYQRIIDKILIPDSIKQAQRVGMSTIDHSYHPWFPVLWIGADKAALYTRALVEDIVHKKSHLTNPLWLMQVGLYLELLTCIGVFEAIKDEYGDLLTPAERKAYDSNPLFAEIRQRVDVNGWRKVWELRHIAFPSATIPTLGPVSTLNLFNKRKAVLAFLHVHHEDLKHAIALVGANLTNAQETWHVVFRDAERAVLRKTPEAFPELDFLTAQMKEFVLWHQQGKLGAFGLGWVPKQFSKLFGDQDGLFAAACNQYRDSMNEVAEWATERGLMEYTGDECVPTEVSLLKAYMDDDHTRLDQLQQRDGYVGQIEFEANRLETPVTPTAEIAALLVENPIFGLLSAEERNHIASNARTFMLGIMQRLVVEGNAGSSLFVIGSGRVEVLVRQPDGSDLVVDVKQAGDVVGELSMLTGAPRSATVRATEFTLVHEIGKHQYAPIIQARPEFVDQLAALMAAHAENVAQMQQDAQRGSFASRIRNFFAI